MIIVFWSLVLPLSLGCGILLDGPAALGALGLFGVSLVGCIIWEVRRV